MGGGWGRGVGEGGDVSAGLRSSLYYRRNVLHSSLYFLPSGMINFICDPLPQNGRKVAEADTSYSPKKFAAL